MIALADGATLKPMKNRKHKNAKLDEAATILKH